MILEGIVTTLNADGSPNISPMGPIVEPSLDRLTLRPFQTSTTYRNLKRTGAGLFHVTDDVELLARAAIGKIDVLPPLLQATAVEGVILADACRWYAFRVVRLDDNEERTTIAPAVVEARRVGLDVVGPLPTDTLMVRARDGEFDAVVAMYHDQGHIALKLLGMHAAVNITLGLPIVRTSVAHGTAFDRAWQGKANHEGMIAAMLAAGELAHPSREPGTVSRE